MLKNPHFYFAGLRQMTVVFGALFNAIQIQRKDDTDVVTKTIDVPIQYAPRQAFLVKLNESLRASEVNIQNTLPRMSYEMTGMTYSPERKGNTHRHQRKEDAAVSMYLKQYNPVPYDVTFDVNIYTQFIDDSLQIVEQIVPYYSPNINVTMNDVPELDIVRDVSIHLDGITPSFEHEGAIGDDDRMVIWTLNFTAKMFLYPPINSVPVIKKVLENIITNDNEKVDMLITTQVDPIDANIGDNWSIVQTTEEF